MEYERLSKKEEQMERQKEINAQSKSATVHKEDKIQLDLSQEILDESKEELISGSYKTATMKDNIDELGGGEPAGPQYIGMSEKFTRKQEGDSDKMKTVRDMLAYYLEEKEKNKSGDADKARRYLIKACDKYCSGRFRIFKWGKGKQRLEEVMALREQVIQESLKEEGRLNEKSSMIYTGDENEYDFTDTDEYKKKGLAKKIISGVGAFFGFTVGNIIKLATFQPLWRRSVSWTPKQYYKDTLDLLDHTVGRTLKVDAYDEDGNVIGEKNKWVRDSYTSRRSKYNSATLAEEKRLIMSDLDMLNSIEEGGEVVDEEQEMDEKYQKELDRIEELKQRDVQTKAERKELTGEKAEAFRQEMKELALDNTLEDKVFDDLSLDKSDEEYDQERLDKMLEDFESLNLNTISFMNHVDMLRDFSKSQKIFEEIRSTHYQLMRGMLRGYKPDDKRLIRLRAKFTCAFEMQSYMIKTNSLVRAGKIDLTKPDDELREEIAGKIKESRFKRIPATPGDIDGLLDECETALQTEYDNRKKTISRVYNATEKGIAGTRMPAELLRSKMDAYESNAVIYDYMQRRKDRYTAVTVEEIISAYAEKHNTEIRQAGIGRMHFNWLYGMKTEDIIRLTKLCKGPDKEEIKKYKEENYTDKQIKAITAKGRIEYYREMIRDLKRFDFSDFDSKDLTKLYENYERKYRICSLFANTEDISRDVLAALNDIRDAEIEEKMKKDPDYKPDPKERLRLPEEFAEFGYANLDEFVKDMSVTMGFGNALQGRFDSVSQAPSQEFLAYYSLSELFKLDADKQDRFSASRESYCNPDNVEKEPLAGWIESVDSYMKLFSIEIRTRPLTKKEKKDKVKPQTLTSDVDLTEILEEEKQYYDRMKFYEGRYISDTKKRSAETEKAKAFSDEVLKIARARNAQVNKREEEMGDGTRLVRNYTSCIAYLCDDTEEKTEERISALAVPVEKATKEQKQTMAKELESAFRVIMDFDLQELNFDNVTDLFDKSYEKAAVMTRFCMDFNALFDNYGKLMDDPDSGTILTGDEYKEVRAKKDFLQIMNAVYNGIAQFVSDPEHQKYDGIQFLSLHEKQQVEELSSAKTNARRVFISNVYITSNAVRQEGIYPGIDMREAYKKRRAAHGAPSKDMTESIKEKLGS